MQNLELKAKCSDLLIFRRLAEEIGAIWQWRHAQQDTYFNGDNGKLKLREVDEKPAELIAYNRPALAQAKISNYNLVIINEPDQFKKVLSIALRQTIIVKKYRDLYLWNNVRIHLDEVQDVGSFVEFEAVIDADNNERISQDRIDYLVSHFNIKESDKINIGYYELLESQN
jgi:adenylate cyclase, class 2